jgi:hypothetical protein
LIRNSFVFEFFRKSKQVVSKDNVGSTKLSSTSKRWKPSGIFDSKKFSPSHLFNDCKKVEQWEIKVYKSFKRKARIESQNDCYSENHTFSWIYNWCIWKNFWEIFYNKFEDCKEIKNQTSNLRKMLKHNEFIHLKLILETRDTPKNQSSLQKETALFSFYQFKNHQK